MTEQVVRRRVVNQIQQPINVCKKNGRVEFLPTGCLRLNLAASQKGRNGGWARGRVINIVGDGSSGKTLLALEALAQAHYKIRSIKSEIFPPVEKLHLVYNNIEGVMDMPVEEMYGQQFYDAVEWIPDINTIRKSPMTCEAFGRDLLGRIDNIEKGEALIYVADSIDSMDSEAGTKRMDNSIKTGKELDGSYGTEKAKYFSANFFNNLCSKMAGKDVTVFLISQVRQIIDKKAFGEKYYRTGGKSLDFYTHQVVWLAQIQKLTNEYLKEKRVYGVRVAARFKRNKTAIPFREAEFDILFNYGIDNVMSCANCLSMEELRDICSQSFKSREDFVSIAEENVDVMQSLFRTVEEKWFQIEEKTKVVRRNRWGE